MSALPFPEPCFIRYQAITQSTHHRTFSVCFWQISSLFGIALVTFVLRLGQSLALPLSLGMKNSLGCACVRFNCGLYASVFGLPYCAWMHATPVAGPNTYIFCQFYRDSAVACWSVLVGQLNSDPLRLLKD